MKLLTHYVNPTDKLERMPLRIEPRAEGDIVWYVGAYVSKDGRACLGVTCIPVAAFEEWLVGAKEAKHITLVTEGAPRAYIPQ